MTLSTEEKAARDRFEQSFPSSARIKREAEIRSQVVTNLSRAFSLRTKAIELAAQFKTDDPMKLAREIYKFLSDTEV